MKIVLAADVGRYAKKALASFLRGPWGLIAALALPLLLLHDHASTVPEPLVAPEPIANAAPPLDER